MTLSVGGLIGLVLGNVPIILLGLALLAPLTIRRQRPAARTLDAVLLLGLGVPMLWAAFYHLVLPEQAARYIGWAPSPFQYEVGVADLAMGAVAVLAPWRPRPYKGAIVWTIAVALLGDACGHVSRIVAGGNLAPGNAGSILWWDILAPLVALGLLFAAHGSDARDD